jgi:hypothetical protein
VGRRIGEKSTIHLGRKKVSTFKFQKRKYITLKVCGGGVCVVRVCV